MFLFLIPLLIGFAFNSASAFTAYYSSKLGERRGKLVCIILRDVVGIPVWAVGYTMAALAKSSAIFAPTWIISILAWTLIVAGATIILVGIISLRWKAAAPSVSDSLVVSGLYAHIRHPLYSGMLLQLVGLFLWFPSFAMMTACLVGVVWVILQARLEEMDLVQRLPAYKEYMQRVPRFVPRFPG